jgi:hypothetical protein
MYSLHRESTEQIGSLSTAGSFKGTREPVVNTYFIFSNAEIGGITISAFFLGRQERAFYDLYIISIILLAEKIVVYYTCKQYGVRTSIFQVQCKCFAHKFLPK